MPPIPCYSEKKSSSCYDYLVNKNASVFAQQGSQGGPIPPPPIIIIEATTIQYNTHRHTCCYSKA